ncbi:MAG: hypothetical protein QNJ91_08550 [Gammaproteobacteria bacterium]|nr:hypothetical protein [Gammaproteobacteria bacterium]
MNKPVDAAGDPIVARVVHKSAIVEVAGAAPVFKLMLNLTPGDRVFEAGSDVGFLPPGARLGQARHILRQYTVESVGRVPFEETIDITIYVREAAPEDSTSVGRVLCDSRQGDTIELFGPFPYPFYPPMGSRSNMVMIGAGCGMVPFRWLAHKVHGRRLDWMGKVLMLEGAETGLEHLYINDPTGDRDQFFDQVTYRAFEALKTRYSAIALDREESTVANMDALWRLMGQGSVYVYLAGYRNVADSLDRAMSDHLRLADRWLDAKKALVRDGHWLEYLYD